MKWEDKVFILVAIFILCLVGIGVGMLFLVKAPGVFKLIGTLLSIGSIYGAIKMFRRVFSKKDKE